MTLAFAGPLGLFALVGLRRRSAALRGALFAAALALLIPFGMMGCSSSSHDQTPPPNTPVTTQIMVNATAGSITHSIPCHSRSTSFLIFILRDGSGAFPSPAPSLFLIAG